jgi:hypothetical protein
MSVAAFKLSGTGAVMFKSVIRRAVSIQIANALAFSTLFNAWLPYRSMPLIAAESERLFVECFV